MLTITLSAVSLLALFTLFRHQGINTRFALGSSLVITCSTLVVTVSLEVPFTRTDQTIFERTVQTTPPTEDSKTIVTGEKLITDIQDKLAQDPNNAKNWFTLGRMYMQLNQFESAKTCFDYTIKLTANPTAGHYAAFATASYYADNQSMNEEVQRSLHKALEIDPLNQAALMLKASDAMLTARYSDAVSAWTKILDSERRGIDRVVLIENINRAKALGR